MTGYLGRTLTGVEGGLVLLEAAFNAAIRDLPQRQGQFVDLRIPTKSAKSFEVKIYQLTKRSCTTKKTLCSGRLVSHGKHI